MFLYPCSLICSWIMGGKDTGSSMDKGCLSMKNRCGKYHLVPHRRCSSMTVWLYSLMASARF